MQIIAASIDLSKIDKAKIVTTDKDGKLFKNGAKYYPITIMLNDEKDKFGNDVAITEGQTKEERTAKKDRKYIGNGKVVWTDENTKPTPAAEKDYGKGTKNDEVTNTNDDLPF